MKYSTVLKDYHPAFENPEAPFLHYYSFGQNKANLQVSLTRGEIWSLAKKAAGVIMKSGCKQGDCFALCFGANHYHDLAFRLAATMTGTVPVTVNWQADDIERICYKIELTESNLILTDSYFNPEHLNSITKKFPRTPLFRVDHLAEEKEASEDAFSTRVNPESTRIVVFTSGTTGQPKGVQLPYRSFQTNRATFEQFLSIEPPDRFAVLIVNPMHHANSTAITDWAMRRPDSHIHLVEKYSTDYWKILSEVASGDYERLIAPTVSRHFDFLENLDRQKRLPVELETLREAMRKTEFLVGSAPVGPTTIKRLQYYSGRIPHVRFGSTETCLQVIGTPRHFPEKTKREAFERGWGHTVKGEAQPGYYIGRAHHPHTEALIVRSITPGDDGYMEPCDMGESGYLVTRGENVLSGYVRNPEETRKVFHDGWYSGLKDICFALRNRDDGELDYYWVSRDSTLLVRGGANYAYDQINAELARFLSHHYQLPEDSFDIAVVGLKVESEHEDSCCVTIEMRDEQALSKMTQIEESFVDLAGQHVSKGAKPDYVRFAEIPRNFKGAILVKELNAEFRKWLDLENNHGIGGRQ